MFTYLSASGESGNFIFQNILNNFAIRDGMFEFCYHPTPKHELREGATLINNAKTGDVISIQVLPPGLTLELRKNKTHSHL